MKRVPPNKILEIGVLIAFLVVEGLLLWQGLPFLEATSPKRKF